MMAFWALNIALDEILHKTNDWLMKQFLILSRLSNSSDSSDFRCRIMFSLFHYVLIKRDKVRVCMGTCEGSSLFPFNVRLLFPKFCCLPLLPLQIHWEKNWMLFPLDFIIAPITSIQQRSEFTFIDQNNQWRAWL